MLAGTEKMLLKNFQKNQFSAYLLNEIQTPWNNFPKTFIFVTANF